MGETSTSRSTSRSTNLPLCCVRRQAELLEQRARDSNVQDVKLTDPRFGDVREQAWFGRYERTGMIRAKGVRGGLACIAVQATGKVER